MANVASCQSLSALFYILLLCCYCIANRKPYHSAPPQVLILVPPWENDSVPANLTKSFQQQLNPGPPHCQKNLPLGWLFSRWQWRTVQNASLKSVAANALSTILTWNGSPFIAQGWKLIGFGNVVWYILLTRCLSHSGMVPNFDSTVVNLAWDRGSESKNKSAEHIYIAFYTSHILPQSFK